MTDPETGADPLLQLEGYLDRVLRPFARVEEVGPFSLFLGPSGRHLYARPRLGLDRPVTAGDVEHLFDRQAGLGVPRAVEWVVETTPSLDAALRAAGGRVELVPLLVLEGAPVAPSSGSAVVDVRTLRGGDPQVAAVRASVSVGFGHAGTAVGTASVAERDAVAVSERSTTRASAVSAELDAGLTVLMGAFDPEVGPVGGGSHNPRGDVSEITGVGVLPAYRRRGIAAALATALARQALDSGVGTVFCSAQSEDVARIYAGIGFRRVGTAGLGEGG